MSTPRLIEQEIAFNGYSLPPQMHSITEQTAGSPSVTMTAGGYVQLLLDTTAEIQGARLSFGDVLSYNSANLDKLEFWAQCSASLASQISVSMGVANAGNWAQASITKRLLFNLTGGGNFTVDAVDGTNSVTGVATNFPVLTSTWQKFVMQFKSGHITIGPPANGIGGVGNLSDCLLSIENYPQGVLRQVCQSTQLNISAWGTGGMQPYFQITKTSNAATGYLNIKHLRAVYRL